MTPSLWLLTAACVAAGQAPAPVVVDSSGSIPYTQTAPEAPRGLRGRLRNFFRPRQQTWQQAPAYSTAPGTSALSTAEPPLLQPTPAAAPSLQHIQAYKPSDYGTVPPPAPAQAAPAEAAPVPEGNAAVQPPEGAPAADGAVAVPLDQRHESKVGNAPDYSWITGQLFYVHADGGRWVLRYASVGQVDKYGGSVVIAPGTEMKNFREGDVVCIHGQVLDEQRPSRRLGGALYRVTTISMIERGDGR